MQIQREAIDLRLDGIREQALDAKAKAEAVIRQIDDMGRWLDKQQLESLDKKS